MVHAQIVGAILVAISVITLAYQVYDTRTAYIAVRQQIRQHVGLPYLIVGRIDLVHAQERLAISVLSVIIGVAFIVAAFYASIPPAIAFPVLLGCIAQQLICLLVSIQTKQLREALIATADLGVSNEP